jgi:predicted metal-dependent phosphoesterase TrpH
MRCDLHVHSRFSGRCTVPVLRRIVDECYAEPEQVYAQARRRGMDLVTLTDHDTISGALRLAGRADTFVSEEVTCLLPGNREVHLGVYDLDEGQHEAIAARRNDAERLFAYLAEQRLPVALNHPFAALTGERAPTDLPFAFARVGLVEGRNSMLPASTNRFAAEAALALGHGLVGGSDAHALRSVALAHTVVPRARTRAEFLAGLRQGFTLPAGRAGSYARFAADLASVAADAYAHTWRAVWNGKEPAKVLLAFLAAAPLLPFLPLVAAGIYAHEILFARRQGRLYQAGDSRPTTPAVVSPAPAAA